MEFTNRELKILHCALGCMSHMFSSINEPFLKECNLTSTEPVVELQEKIRTMMEGNN